MVSTWQNPINYFPKTVVGHFEYVKNMKKTKKSASATGTGSILVPTKRIFAQGFQVCVTS